MVPALPETSWDDTEFDLDVRLEAVARQVSDERGPKPGPEGTVTCSCEQCPTGVTCGCFG
jgi:hypothetical protein